MAWSNEAALPFTPSGWIDFSPNFGGLTYIIDMGNINFYKYNAITNTYTQLTAPTYSLPTNGGGTFYRSLALSPNGTKLACISDGVANHRGGRRIEIYTIAGNSWAASSQVQNMDDETPFSQGTSLSGLVWADEDTIWIWAHQATTGVLNYTRCIKYTISTDTFTIYSTLLNGGLTYAQAFSAAINSAGTIIYGSGIGATARGWYKYTISGDSYVLGGTLTLGRVFAVAIDNDKLWYGTTADYRPGYIDTTDDSENDNQFEENTDRDAGYGLYISVKDNLSFVMAHARAAAPELMSVGYAVTYPTPSVGTLSGLDRVSSIRHIFRPGFFRMQAGLGDLGFDVDVAETAVRRELDTATPVEPKVSPVTGRPLPTRWPPAPGEFPDPIACPRCGMIVPYLELATHLRTMHPAPTKFPAYEAQIEYEEWFQKQMEELRERGAVSPGGVSPKPKITPEEEAQIIRDIGIRLWNKLRGQQ